MQQQKTFQTQLAQDPDGIWWYVHVPKEIRDIYKPLEKRGIIHVTARIGQTTWGASMLPWADGSAQISVNQKVSDKENLKLGDMQEITVAPR